VAAVDGSGRVREHTVLAALGWGRDDALEIRVARTIAVLRAAPHGRLRVDERGQIALPAGCRAMLGIAPGHRVVLAAIPARAVALVCPMQIAGSWITVGAADLPGIFDA
jgi:AbrB family looped-hinge helix DNA binding protein